MIKQVFQKQFLLELLLWSILVAVLHLIAIALSLYWIIEWFDILMHFLGGMTMAYLALFLFFTSGYLKRTAEVKNNKFVVFLVVTMFTAVIGLGWELWELFVGISSVYLDMADTILDLIMDMLGALFLLFITRNKI
jgi:hypothetical protein